MSDSIFIVSSMLIRTDFKKKALTPLQQILDSLHKYG